jgi:hypothetical protein
MIKTYKNFIIIFLILILILLFFLKKYNNLITQNQIDILVSNNIELINSEVSYQKKYALSLAILFSKNQNIINALIRNQPKQLKSELDTLLTTISNYTNLKNIQIQVHTKDLKVFFRSWEDKDQGLNLTSFRHGLVKVQQTKQPFVSNELGKRLNIKAISPIFNNDKYIGSLEVIMNYSSLKEKLKKANIEIIPLLNSRFLDIAKYHKNNKKLYDYVMIEKNYNENLYNILLHNKTILLQKKFYYEIGDTIITFIPLGYQDNKTTGYLVASFKNSNQNFSYLPNYEYKGSITSSISEKENINNKKNIIIK